MKILKSFFTSILVLSVSLVFAQEGSSTINQIQQAIKKADAPALASFFHSTIDLEVADTDGNYSKNQAEMILRDFFRNHPVKSFAVRHQGSSNDGSKYLIGAYTSTQNQEFRVYVLLKGNNEDLLIHQLQFETD